MTLATSPAPLLVVDAPRPQPPLYRLIDVATIVDEPDLHWQAGVRAWGRPTETPSAFDPCSAGTYRTKTSGGTIPLPEFAAFTVYLTESCTPRSIFRGGMTDAEAQDEYVARALASFAARESYAVEVEFARGLTIPLSPHLCDTNCVILGGGTAQPPKVGLSYLADSLGATGSNGIIHATPAIVAAWGQFRSYRGDDDRLYTVEGTPIAEGTGYIGAAPEPRGAPPAGQGWAFVTGPVDVRRSQAMVYPGELRQALDRTQNLVTYRVERTYVVDWDTNLQSAVLIDWTSTST